MTFLNPWMLLGAATVAIPLTLHFFYRAHYKPHPWAAMKFLRLAMEQTSRRLRFQELLLLLLRIAVCALLAFALARPASSALTAGGGRGEAVDAVIVIDNSYSMEAKETDTATRLDRAKEAAIKIIDNLPPRSTVQVVACANKAQNLGPRSPSNLDQARHLVKNLRTGSLGTDYLAGLTEALESFGKTAGGGSKEVYLIGDMQRSGWESQPTAVRSKCEEIKAQASLYLVRVGEQPIKDVAVVGVLPQTEVPRAGEPVSFTILLRNSGAAPVENLSVSLGTDGQDAGQKDRVAVNRVDVGETKAVTAAVKFPKPGWQLVTARLNDAPDEAPQPGSAPVGKASRDGLEENNTYSLMVQVHEKIRVLIVDGSYNASDPSRSGSFYVGNALLPVEDGEQAETYHLSATATRPRDADEGQLFADGKPRFDVCILANVAARELSGEFVQALGQFVRSGKGLFIGSGANVVPADYNEVFGDLLPAPLANEPPYIAPRDDLAAPDPATIDVYSFLARLRDKGNNPLASLAVGFTSAITPVDDPAQSKRKAAGRVLMRFNDGRPMLLSKPVGAGESMMLTTTLDNTWSILCVTRAFPPFINGCVGQMVQRAGNVYNHTAGDPVKWAPTDDRAEYHVYRPDGERSFLGKPGANGLLPSFDTTRAGVYTIAPSDREKADGQRLVFNPDLSESENLESITDDGIDAQLGFRPVHLSTGFDGSSFTGTERSRNEWTVWALAALLIFCLGEMLFAWACGRTW